MATRPTTPPPSSAPHGLIAYLSTPLREGVVDLVALGSLVERAVAAGVDGLGVLGSTGAALHLDRDERRAVVRAAVEHAAEVPVVAGISALRTDAAKTYADDAHVAGAAALLLAPVGYVPLVHDEVIGLFEDVLSGLDVPLVVYDNPTTTRVDMTTGLLTELAGLPGVAGIKTPGPSPAAARARIMELRRRLPPGIALGFSGDASGPAALAAGADAWHSTLAGALPEVFVSLARSAGADSTSDRLDPSGSRPEGTQDHVDTLFALVRRHAGVRVAATILELLGVVAHPSLPRPLLPLTGPDRDEVAVVLRALGSPTVL